MAEIDRTVIFMFNLLILSLLLLSSSYIQVSNCSKPVGIDWKDDIQCQVCEKLAKELYDQVRDKKEKKKITVDDINEISDNVCNWKKQKDHWMHKIDIVEKGDRSELVEQDYEGQCFSECKKIERTCKKVIRYDHYDDTNDGTDDVAEYIYNNNPQMSSLVDYLRKDRTKACNTKPPPVPKLVEQDSEGQCCSRCKTIERVELACKQVIRYDNYDDINDVTDDVLEYINKKKPQMSSLVVNFLCKRRTKACNTKPPPVPKKCWTFKLQKWWKA